MRFDKNISDKKNVVGDYTDEVRGREARVVVGPQKYCNGGRNQNFENSREAIVFFVVFPDLFINSRLARVILGQLFRETRRQKIEGEGDPKLNRKTN